MNPEWKRKWVDALRSGEYKQGREVLKSGDEFCCLGVLADLCAREGAVDGHWTEGDMWKDQNVDYEECQLLPRSVQQATGIAIEAPTVESRSLRVSITLLNDGDHIIPRHSFEEIADIIEEQL